MAEAAAAALIVPSRVGRERRDGEERCLSLAMPPLNFPSPLSHLLPRLLVLLSYLSFCHAQSGYTQEGLPWSVQSQPAPWPGRYGASAAVTAQGAFVMLGGLAISNLSSATSSNFTLYNDIQQSTSTGATFVTPAPTAPWSPRFFHSSALTSAGSILLIGGFTLTPLTTTSPSTSPPTVSSLKDTWYSVDGISWSQGSTMPWSRGRGGHDIDSDPNSLIFYLTAGLATDPGYQDQLLNDVWKTPDAGTTWQIATITATFSARVFHNNLVRQGVLYVIGGLTKTATGSWTACQDVWMSVDQGTTFTQQMPSSQDFSFMARFLTSGIVYNNDDLFYMAGLSVSPTFTLLSPLAPYFNSTANQTATATIYSDVWESTDAGLSWQQTNPTSVYGARFSAPLVILNQDLLLMGGCSNVSCLSDVWLTVLPLDGQSSDGTVVAAVVGTLSGILMIVVVVIRRMEDRFAKGVIKGYTVSGQTEEELAEENSKL